MKVKVTKPIVIILIFILNVNKRLLTCAKILNYYDIDLPSEHLPFFFNFHREAHNSCKNDPECAFKMHLDKNVCWGFEKKCDLNPRSYSHPLCDGDSRGWTKTKDEQIKTFYKQADFGYIRHFQQTLKPICIPHDIKKKGASALDCSSNLTFCRGKNIRIDFSALATRKKPVMYDTDVLSEGDMSGYCALNKTMLMKNMEFMGALQSWGAEVQNFVESETKIKNTKKSKICDRIIKKPTIIMKIDATVNMYHHFCDFFNLYASLHVNSSAENDQSFSRDNQIIIWRTYPYHSNFKKSFEAFSSNSILDLNDFKGEKICFQNVIFPLLPRMIFGLYYNTPIVWGCRNSGLFHAFSKFFLHRMRIDMRTGPVSNKIKITFLSRVTSFRKVLNEDDLIGELRKIDGVTVRKAQFSHNVDFEEQLKIIQDTDILIGVHGAGLTHLLFLPDWAVVFELYNCEDPNCYSDLARLRGVKYLTWRDTSKLKYEDISTDFSKTYFQKHANYRFDKEEFVKISQEAIEYVKEKIKEYSQFSHDEL